MKKFFTWLYFIFLSWLVLFKLSPDIPNFLFSRTRSVNLAPFTLSGGLLQDILNVVVFVPMGLLLATASKKWRFSQQFGFLLLLSLVYEILQYLLAIGVTDVTDWLTNSFGSLIGVLGYLAIKKATNEKIAVTVSIFISLLVMILSFLVSYTDLLGVMLRFYD